LLLGSELLNKARAAFREGVEMFSFSGGTDLPSSLHFLPTAFTKHISTEQQLTTGHEHSHLDRKIDKTVMETLQHVWQTCF
jgi:hypothetical protein